MISRRDQTGQMTVELVLIMIVLLGVFMFVSKTLSGQAFISRLIQSPWTMKVAGMIENGVWGSPEGTRDLHPNAIKRHSSLRGERVQ